MRSVRADAHYTRVHDGTRERMCPWSISEAEAQLDPGLFVRVHRSHIVAIPHVSFVRKEGDGAVIELDGPSPHRVPVSRAKIAEVKARLGLAKAARLKARNPALPYLSPPFAGEVFAPANVTGERQGTVLHYRQYFRIDSPSSRRFVRASFALSPREERGRQRRDLRCRSPSDAFRAPDVRISCEFR